jgi:hypothetical protein
VGWMKRVEGKNAAKSKLDEGYVTQQGASYVAHGPSSSVVRTPSLTL